MKESLSGYKYAVPEKLKIPSDPLTVRLDFHTDSVVMYEFGDINSVKLVSALDVAKALASGLTLSSGIQPDNTLWWSNTREGPVFAIWERPRVRRVALQAAMEAPLRFDIPLPGLIFLCSPGRPPRVYAAKRKPSRETDLIYHAPLCNIFQDGRSCPGNHKYPEKVSEIIESFFQAFFSPTAHLTGRSKKFSSVVSLWKHLDGKKEYPLGDLVKFGTVKDLL